MKIFSGSSNRPLAEKIAKKLGLSLSPLEIHSFPDGEKRVRVLDKVLDEDIILVQPTSPPVNLNYMELFLITDALKRSGASSITLVAPYLGYQRQDHIFREGEGVTFSMIAKILETLEIDKIITFDLHTIKIPEFFKIGVLHLSALALFAEKIREISGQPSVVLVSPDMGGLRRIRMLSELLGNIPTASVVKNRNLKTGKIDSSEIQGEVLGKTAIIVDDMISTGETLEGAISLIKKQEALKIYVFATHPVFSKNATERLKNFPVERFYVTDSVYVPDEKKIDKLEIISIADLIAKELKKL